MMGVGLDSRCERTVALPVGPSWRSGLRPACEHKRSAASASSHFTQLHVCIPWGERHPHIEVRGTVLGP